MSKRKLYFQDETELEQCYDREHYEDLMQAEGLTEIKVFEAVKSKDKDYFYCSKYFEVGEKGNCGKICDAYAPRNGKSGCCKHVGRLYEGGEEIILKLKNKKPPKKGGKNIN